MSSRWKISSPNSTNSLPVLICLNLPSFLSTSVHDEFCIQTFFETSKCKKLINDSPGKETAQIKHWYFIYWKYSKKSIQNKKEKIHHYKLHAEQKMRGEIRVKHHVASEVSWGPNDLATDGAPDKGRGENPLNFWGNPITFSGKQNKKITKKKLKTRQNPEEWQVGNPNVSPTQYYALVVKSTAATQAVKVVLQHGVKHCQPLEKQTVVQTCDHHWLSANKQKTSCSWKYWGI